MRLKFEHRKFDLKTDEALLRIFAFEHSEKVPDKIMFLPPTGFVVFHEEAPVCLGFMIKCDNGMVINSDFLSDKKLPKEMRNQGVQYLRGLLAAEALACGAKFVTAFTKHEKLADRLEALGYTKMDKGFIQMGRVLWR